MKIVSQIGWQMANWLIGMGVIGQYMGESTVLAITSELVGSGIALYTAIKIDQSCTAKSAVLVVISSIIFIHFLAILFGAPVITNIYATFSFAWFLTSIGTLPSLSSRSHDKPALWAPNSSFPLSFSLSQQFQSIQFFLGALFTHFANAFQSWRDCPRNFRLAALFFGAWLGAIVFPLDWDRPWQVWPVPCVFSGMVLFSFSSFLSLFLSW